MGSCTPVVMKMGSKFHVYQCYVLHLRGEEPILNK